MDGNIKYSKDKLNELEEWIKAYDNPVDRVTLLDIFYELKDEIEYWKSMYENCRESEVITYRSSGKMGKKYGI